MIMSWEKITPAFLIGIFFSFSPSPDNLGRSRPVSKKAALPAVKIMA